MEHTKKWYVRACALAVVFFIGSATLAEAQGVRTDPSSRVSERLEAMGQRLEQSRIRVETRLEEAQARMCNRMSARLMTPAFCIVPEEEADKEEEKEEKTEKEEKEKDESEEEQKESEEESEEERQEEDEEETEEGSEEEPREDESEEESEEQHEEETEEESGEEQQEEEAQDEEETHEDADEEQEEQIEGHGRVVFSEVYYFVASDRGIDPNNEWVELYNDSDADVDISGWRLVDNNATRTLPVDSSVPARGFAVIVATSATLAFWDIPEEANVIDLGARIGNGLGNGGDELYLIDPEDEQIDALSWGSFTTVFDPAIPAIPAARRGASIARCPIHVDTGTASDWVEKEMPTPGSASEACRSSESPDDPAGDESEEQDEQTEEGSEEEAEEQDEQHEGDAENGAEEEQYEEQDEHEDEQSGMPASDRVLITEVYYFVEADRGSDPNNEWVELYNGTDESVDLSGWQLRDNGPARIFAEGTTLDSGQFALVVATSATLAFWDVPDDVLVIDLGARIGNGLGNTGDELYLESPDETIVDALSWGSFTTVFDPAIPAIPAPRRGASIARCPLTLDTDTASDWVEKEIPTPGSASEACLGADAPDGVEEEDDQDGTEEENGGAEESSEEDESRHEEDPNGSADEHEESTDPSEGTRGVVFSEIYYFVANDRGTDPNNEWVELYNAGDETVDLSDWLLRDNNTARTLPEGSELASGQYMVIIATTTTLEYWSILENAVIVNLNARIGNGLGNTGDQLYLLTPEEEVVDALSWGDDTNVFDPAIPAISAANRGASLARIDPAAPNTMSPADWEERAEPTPGQ